MEKNKPLSLVVGGLTLEEIEELLRLVREIELRHPRKPILCSISGLEGKSKEEAQKILREIFPQRGVAS